MESKAPQRTLQRGDMLNWYRVERVLGRGGFGVIYLAIDTNLQHQVAIKQLRTGGDGTGEWTLNTADTELDSQSQRAFSDRESVRRFIAEARHLVRFKHPNIVRVISAFELHDTAYMVMEYEEGVDLRTHLQWPPNRTESALKSLILPILHGLMEVHRHGLIHRDIKPANMLVRPCGSPVLLDFGSARPVHQAAKSDMTALVSAGYSPLEQYDGSNGRQQGPWTDIYALGAVLYQAVANTEPVDSAQRGSALINGGRDPLLPARLLGRDRYSQAFLRAIDWALAFRIDDRPQSLEDWQRALLRTDPATSQATATVVDPRAETATFAQVQSTGPIHFTPGGRTTGRQAHESVSIVDVGEQYIDGNGGTQSWPGTHHEQHSARRSTATSPVRARLIDWWLRLRRPFGRRWYWLLPLSLMSVLAMSWLWLLGKETWPILAGSLIDGREVALAPAQVSTSKADSQNGVSATTAAGLADQPYAESIENKTGSPLVVDTEHSRPLVHALRSEGIETAQAEDELAYAQQEQTLARAVAQARERERQIAAEAEAARLAALEVSRQERLRERRLRLIQALDRAESFLDEGRLDDAQSSLDEAAALNRNAARLKTLRARWRAALEDARTPVSDSDFDSVIVRFDRLRRAIEGGDIATIDALTERSDQNTLFKQLIDNFAELDVRIDQIRVTNVHKSISARLRIERMIRENGDRTIPSPAYQNREISSRRIEGQWSAIRW